MLKRIVEASRAVIVHNPAAAELVRQHAPATPVVEVPHLFQPAELPSASEVLAFRRRLGMAGAFVFGVFGYLRESKRLFAVMRAFEAVHRARPDTALLVAGGFVSSDLARAVAPLLERPGIIRLPYLPEREFWRAAAAVDASISLRYPAAGETSGISIRLMGIGKPVLLTAGLATSRYPQTACLRVDPGLAERDSLWHHMILLISITEVGRAIGRRGAEHIALHHSVDRIADQYWKTLCAYRA
jgi:glycosyltransferase involved in cell wall biosynthesis